MSRESQAEDERRQAGERCSDQQPPGVGMRKCGEVFAVSLAKWSQQGRKSVYQNGLSARHVLTAYPHPASRLAGANASLQRPSPITE